MKLVRFTIKDIIFIAILSAVITLAGSLTMPLVMSVSLFGLRNMVSALLYALFVSVGLLKVRKMGALTLIGFLHGSVLLMMAPVMFFTMFFGSLIAEGLTLLCFKNYNEDKSIAFAATLFIPFTLPFTLVFTMLIHGQKMSEVIERPFVTVLIMAMTILLSFIGMKIGMAIGKELKKAGKL